MADQGGEAARGATLRPKVRRSNRLKLIYVATRNVPQDVNSEEGLAIVSILVEARIIDIDQEESLLSFDFSRLTHYKVNNGGRIVSLGIGLGMGANENDNWMLSEDILKLRSLEHLHLCSCGQIPFNLNLPHLTTLVFHNCRDEVLENYRVLNGVRSTLNVVIVHEEFASNNISSLITSISKFPSLNALILMKLGEHVNLDPLLQQLQQNAPILRGKLAGFGMLNSNLTQDHLVTLFCNTLPLYDHIEVLTFQGNRIESLKVLADRIADIPSHTSCFNTIRGISLIENPVFKKLKDNNNTDEKAALLTILSRFKRIERIEGSTYSISSYGPEIEYALRIAHAGRILVEGTYVDYSHGDNNKMFCDNDNNEDTEGCSNNTFDKSIVPLSV